MKQKLILKPVKKGFKVWVVVWVVAEGNTGYVLHLQVCVGKEGSSEYGLAERVVLELTEKYRCKAHQVFCDNYFSSP